MAASELNPFATRFTRPGAIDFLFGDDESAAALLERLRDNNWWGQIVGPHGSGKSTLLAALAPALEAAGRHVIQVSLHQGEHRLPSMDAELTTSSQLVIDGYEQLGWFWRRRTKSRCRRAGCGLLVTTHRDLGLPTIYATRPSERLMRDIVARLLPRGGSAITEADVAAAYSSTDGNLRETLFRLFDVYEARNRHSA